MESKMNKCNECGKETDNPKFCSSSCSATYNNVERKRKPLKNCKNCGKEFFSRHHKKQKFCSNECFQTYQREDTISKWLSGEIPGNQKGDIQSLKSTIRKYLLEKNNYKCSVCEWGEYNPFSKTSALEVDHINGDTSNNRPENLRVLCPNCHSLTEFYGILNKGNGRKRYRELYHKNK